MSTDDPLPGTRVEPVESLRARAVRASMWWVAAYPITRVIQVVGNILLAMLLTPSAFGLVAVSSVVVGAVTMFSEIGIGYALVQSARDDERFVNTAWTIQVVRGAIIFLVCALLAYPIALAYSESELVAITLVIALGSLVSALRSTKMIMLNRYLDERPRAMLEVYSHIVSRIAMVGLALVWPCALAIVLGNFLGIVAVTVATHRLPGPRNRLAWDRDAARALLMLGSWVVVGSVIAYLGSQLDALVLSRLVTVELGALGLVGVYTLAQRIASIPLEAGSLLGGTLGFPVLAEVVRREPARLRERVMQIRHLLLGGGVTLCIGVVALAPHFFDIFYDDRYAAAQWMAPLLMLPVWINFLNQVPNRALLAMGRTKTLALTGGLRVLAAVVFSVVGFGLLGVPGFIIGVALGDLLRHIAESIALGRSGCSVAGQDVKFSAVFLLLAAACVLVPRVAAVDASGVLSIGLNCVPLVILAGASWWSLRLFLRAMRAR